MQPLRHRSRRNPVQETRSFTEVQPRPLERGFRRLQAFWRHLEIFGLNQFRHMVQRNDLLHPVYAIYEMTFACNLNCTYCDDGAGRSYPSRVREARPLPLSDVFKMLERLRREVPGLYLCGGEPTIHPRFLEILQHTERLGFQPIMLNTNGLMLPELLQKDPNLFKRMDVVILSIDSLKPDTLDRLFRGRPGDGQRVLEVLDLCSKKGRDDGCAVVLNCVITRDTVDDAREVAAYSRKHGLLFTPVLENLGRGLREPLTDLSMSCALVKEVLGPLGPRTLGPPSVFEKLLENHKFECHPTVRIHITPNGCVPWPCQSDRRFALSILDYPSVSELLSTAEARFSVQGHGRRCGSRCYLAQNVSTDIYLSQPISTLLRAVRDFVLKNRGIPLGSPALARTPKRRTNRMPPTPGGASPSADTCWPGSGC